MHSGLFRLSLTILLALSSSFSLAADLQDLGRDRQAITRASNSANLNEAFGLTRQETLAISKSRLDNRGGNHTHYQQALQGVPVWGERVIIGRDQSGKVTYVRGRLIRGLAQELTNVNPTLEADAVLNTMKATAQDRKIGMVKLQFSNESSELVIYLDDRQPKLSYAVSFFADAPSGGHPTRPTFIVDAHTGQIIFEYEGLTHVEVGTGPGGNIKTGQHYYGDDYPALDVEEAGSTCTMNNANVKTVDLNHGTVGSTAYSFTCPENLRKHINYAYSPLNDAHYFGGVVFDMYSNWLGTSPLTDQLMMRVHYSTNYDNAFWNGSSMTFGDGYITFYPLVSLDVSAHEVSHGFTEQNSNLIYSGQPGGINEAFSDIAGEAAEYYAKGTNDFLVGADIVKPPYSALRNMATPTSPSIGHVDGYYNGLDVHYSSGLYNKAFYHLATTSGWDVQKAFTLFADANRLTWGPRESFDSAFYGLRLLAVHDVNMDYSQADLDAIDDAFGEVGIPTPDPVCDHANSTILTNGVSTADFPGATGEWKCWKVDVVPDATTTNLDVVLRNTASGRNKRLGDADLYINHADPLSVIPTVNPPEGNYDCGSYTSNSSESCRITTPNDGYWYIGVYGYSGYTSVSLTASYDTGGTEEPPPSSGEITLTAAVKGNGKFVNLTWSGATTPEVDIYRDGAPYVTTVNDGSYKDNGGFSGMEYQVCDSGGTDNCSGLVPAT